MASSLVLRQLVQPLSGGIGVRARLGHPEEELRERILQGVGEHDADLFGCSHADAHLVLERANPSNTLEPRAAVPAVDEILDSSAERTERKRDDQRCQRDDPRGVATDDDPSPTVIAA